MAKIPHALQSGTPNTATNDNNNSHSKKGTNKLTRLQKEALSLIAFDVEYCHIKLKSTDRLVQLPTEVCLVDYQGNEIYRSMIDSLMEIGGKELVIKHTLWSFAGGTPVYEWYGAPLLSTVREDLIKEIKGKPIVGHNLVKDLTALGLEDVVPLHLRRDTMKYPKLQSARGFGCQLADLTERKLGRTIQTGKHDPREDAVAALDLYLEYCHYDPELMEYDDLVEYYASQFLDSSSVSESDKL